MNTIDQLASWVAAPERDEDLILNTWTKADSPHVMLHWVSCGSLNADLLAAPENVRIPGYLLADLVAGERARRTAGHVPAIWFHDHCTVKRGQE